jgi:DNA-binding MarR family transcriptional regulator
MAESEHVQKDISAIRTRLDQIESMQRLIVAANPDVQTHVRAILQSREHAAAIVVMLADGPLLQDDIVERLGKSQPTVSKVLTYLHDAGLLLRYSDPENARKVRWGLNELEATVRAVKVAKEIVGSQAKAAARRSGSKS